MRSARPSAPDRPVLELECLSRHFDRGARRIVALDRVSLALEPGRMVGLVGRNGAGKTTLLRCAAGLLKPSAGRVRVLGADLERCPRVVTGAVGTLEADDRTFPPRLTPLESLALYGGLRGLTRRESRARARELADELGAGDLLGRPFQSLSSGQRQRIGIVRALLHRPRVLLLDEPVHALDRRAARSALEVVRRRCERGALALISSHDLEGIEELCDELVVLEGGRVVTSGERSAVLPSFEAPGWRVVFESARARAVASKRFAGLRPATDPVEAVIEERAGERPCDLEALGQARDAGVIALHRRERISLEELVAEIDGARPIATTAEAPISPGPPASPETGAPTGSRRGPASATPASAVQGALGRGASLLSGVLAIARRDLATELTYRFKILVQAVLLFVWAGMFLYLARVFRHDDPELEAALFGNPYEFLLIGLAALEISRLCMTHMGRALREEQLLGTLEPLFATGRSPLLIVASSLVWPLASSLLTMVVALFFATELLGADFSRANWPAVAAATALGCVVVGGLGLVSAGFVHAFKRGDPVATVVNLAGLVVAGAYFPRELLPDAVQRITAALPHTTALAALRAAMLGGSGFSDPRFRAPFLALAVTALVIAPIALGAWILAHRLARTRGSLTDA